MRKLIILAWLVFITQFAQAGCKPKQLEGKWAGLHLYNLGASYSNIISFTALKNCKVKGFIQWIGYYNSQQNFTGHMEGDSLFMSFGAVMNGKFWIPEMTAQLIWNKKAETLVGIGITEGEVVSEISLKAWETLSQARLKEYKQLLRNEQARYGHCRLVGPARTTYDQIISGYKKNYNALRPNQWLKAEGKFTNDRMSQAAKIKMYYTQNALYMTTELMGMQMIQAKDSILSWEYNGFDDVLTIDSTGYTNAYQFNTRFDPDSHYEVVQIDSVSVEKNQTTIPATRLVVKQGEALKVFCFSENFELVRSEDSDGVDVFTDFYKGDNWVFPKKGFLLSTDEVMQITITDIQLISDQEVDKSLWEIPEEYLTKLKLPTRDAEYFNEQGLTLFEEGNYKKASVSFENALNLNSQNEVYWFNKARAQYYLSNYYDAVSDATQAVRLYDTYAKAYNIRGMSKYQLGDYGNAVKDFKLAVQYDSSSAQMFLNLSRSFYFLGELDSAKIHAQKASQLDSTNAEFQADVGVIHYELGEYAQAESRYKKAIALDYQVAATQNRLGVVQFLQGNYQNALMNFEESLQLEDLAQTRMNKARTLYQLERYAEAADLMEELLVDDKKNHDVQNKLGICYFHLENYELAKLWFDKAIKLSKQAEYYDNRASTRLNLMDYQGAIADYTMSINLNPDKASIWLERGRIRMIQNNRFDACQDFKQAADMGNAEARKALDEHCH